MVIFGLKKVYLVPTEKMERSNILTSQEIMNVSKPPMDFLSLRTAKQRNAKQLKKNVVAISVLYTVCAIQSHMLHLCVYVLLQVCKCYQLLTVFEIAADLQNPDPYIISKTL